MRTTRLRGARTHNLQSVDLDFEPGTLVAIAGPSGAGKSSLAFSTLYAEGQRRYVESFSAYARQFLERLARPPVDELEPIAAGVAVDRQAPVRTSRSTVGTMTEVADYAKSLWARASELHCRQCGEVVTRDSAEGAVDALLASQADQRALVVYPQWVRDAEGFLLLRERLVESGYRRVLIDGKVCDLDEVPPSEVVRDAPEAPRKAKPKTARKKTAKKKASKKKSKKKSIEAPIAYATFDVVADRAVLRSEDRGRLVEAVEAAMTHGEGKAAVVVGDTRHSFSRALHCARCDLSYRDPTPGLFSFNSAVGACETCRGFGRVIGVDWEKVFRGHLGIKDGGIACWGGKATQWERKQLDKFAKAAGIDPHTPIRELSDAQRTWLIEGDELGYPKGWFGVRAWFTWLEKKAYKMHVRVLLSRFRSYETCPACEGTRLTPDAQLFRIEGRTIAQLMALPASEACAFIESLGPLREARGEGSLDGATGLLVDECGRRLRTLCDVGLGYLTLDRASRTLSGGESQRVALTSALAASLTGAMFVLDEPTVGLHPSDVEKLIGVVKKLARGDNLAIIVEHDPDLLRAADRVIELGPGAGEHGGRVVFDGTPRALHDADTATGRALRGDASVRRPRRRSPDALVLRGATGNNLRGDELRIPLGVLTCVTGPSGSGKSSLILETLVGAATRARSMAYDPPLPFEDIEGCDALTSVVGVDQSPLGRTSRGNPATYLGAWDLVRARFAREPLAKDRGYHAGFFSFNVPGGRCETCKGDGAETVEMQFLADVTFSCPDCGGKRFVGPILDVRHRDLDIAELLDLTATEACEVFAEDKRLLAKIEPMLDVGLGYLRLGQSLNTLSGGEAQRLKLALALSSAPRGSLIVLDEPTAGLHAKDVTPLLGVLDRLVERGDTVVVVEHDMRVAAFSDHVIDLGPGAGEQGGHIVAQGTPEEVARDARSITAPHLALALDPPEHAPAPVARAVSDDSEQGAFIRVQGAREHNLQNVSIDIPREQLVVVTGPSGSGKSSLAFDVVYAEGQRRYLETLSPYARQYLPQLPRPEVDRVLGIPPSVSLEQRTTRGGSTSTVATVTEVAHYLRLLWARAGLLHCVDCGVPISARAPALLTQDMVARFGKRALLTVLSPVVRGRKGHHRELLDQMRERGFEEARIDGGMRPLEAGMSLARFVEHDVEIVVAHVSSADQAALESAIRRAAELSEGSLRVLCGDEDLLLSTHRACPSCGRGYPELDPRFFSFNTRQGQCEPCEGAGSVVTKQGRGKNAREVRVPCEACEGTRLSALARAVTFDERPITALLGASVSEARALIATLRASGRDAEIAKAPIAECERRLAFLEEVGLGYLGLDRPADTLSGGETQRVRLAAQLGSGLTGLLYVLDEPTIGLHPRDTGLLIGALRGLVEKGNSVVVVEHDADVIRAADHTIDVGPGGGRRGGVIVAQGPPSVLMSGAAIGTGASLARAAYIPSSRRPVDLSGKKTPMLTLRGASGHNLRDLDVKVPLGRLVCVTGVSGSGKSTLVRRVLLPAVRRALELVDLDPALPYASLTGAEHLERAVMVDQSPIGRTPRSIPATYIGIWDEIRRLLARTQEARARGWTASRFSFNVSTGGRCTTCDGNGALKVEMAFLPDVYLPCDGCAGMRFTRETLEPKVHGLSAGAILKLEVEEAAQVLCAIPNVARPLALLDQLGLGYLELGQASNTLSGGEAQRIKLVAELGTAAKGRTLYVLDEPTTGLHRDDVARLRAVLEQFVERGDTVLVIEHHLDVILASDWVIDLGPEGGVGGGRVVVEGTPEQVAACAASYTGRALAEELSRGAAATAGGRPKRERTKKIGAAS